jgi:excisionase family DNA binding protein
VLQPKRCVVSLPLSVKEAGEQLRLSPATVYALCAAKKLRHQRVGVGRGKILIPPDAIQEYLAKGTVKSTEPHPAALLLSAARK